jgi:hypothetical protein
MRLAIAAAVFTFLTGPALAQTQRTPPSAYATMPTWPSAFATAPISPCYVRWSEARRHRWLAFNPYSSCYGGYAYPYYSAFEQPASPGSKNRAALFGAANLDESEARSRIEAKGYLNVSGLEQDPRGIWRGKAATEDGRSLIVILDLEGNIYSEWSTLHIQIERAPFHKKVD